MRLPMLPLATVYNLKLSYSTREVLAQRPTQSRGVCSILFTQLCTDRCSVKLFHFGSVIRVSYLESGYTVSLFLLTFTAISTLRLAFAYGYHDSDAIMT